MTISMELIKKVREATGAGVNDVKKALDEVGGDEEKAIEYLRKQGQKIAAKKADRSTNEGVIAVKQEGNKIALVELYCETDFVARNDDFLKSSEEFVSKLLEVGKEEFATWAKDEVQNNLIVKIGENIQLGKFEIIESSSAGEGEVLGIYLHSNKKIASVVNLSGGTEELAKEVAMHVTAMNPSYLKAEDVPTEKIEKEKEIYREQLKAEGKPEEMIKKILEGKLKKYYTEVCLLNQPFVKDDKISVEKLLNGVEVKQFVRFSL